MPARAARRKLRMVLEPQRRANEKDRGDHEPPDHPPEIGSPLAGERLSADRHEEIEPPRFMGERYERPAQGIAVPICPVLPK
jgi:hypothetical protein